MPEAVAPAKASSSPCESIDATTLSDPLLSRLADAGPIAVPAARKLVGVVVPLPNTRVVTAA